MNIIKTMTLFILLTFTILVKAQINQDSVKVLETVSLYNQGWYAGDSAKMSKALHPELVKRIVQQFKDTGNDVVNNLSYNLMIQYVIAGYGKHTPKEKQNDKVILYDIYGNIANVKVESEDIVEYLQLVKFSGEWKILNVLWDMKPNSEN